MTVARRASDALLPWACVALVVGRLTALAIAAPPGDGDRYWQYWLGERILREHAIPRALGPETFSAPGAPWVPQEWLFSTALAWTVDRGLAWLVPLACALVAGIAFAAVIRRCTLRGIPATRTSAAVLFCGLASAQAFGVRAQVVGWAGTSLTLWLLELEGPAAWAAVPLTFVWANLHASAFLAPAIAFVFALSAVIRDRRWSRAAGRYAAIGAACATATLLSPLGLDLPRYAAGLMSSPIRASIAEWGATSTSTLAFTSGALPLLLILVAFGVRAPVRDRIVAVTFALLLFEAVRNVPLFAFAVAPIALAALPAQTRAAAPPRFAGIVSWFALAAAGVAAVAVTVLTWSGAPAMRNPLPVVAAAALIERAHGEPRVFCEDFAWCSLFLVQPMRVAFFMDGRSDPYPPEVWRDYRRVLDGNAGWSAVLDRFRVNAVLARRDGALDSLLRTQPQTWRSIASPGPARLYVRPALLAGAPVASR